MRVKIQNKDIFLKVLKDMFPELKTLNINGLSIDSRNIKPGDIFLPLKGKRNDGHQFIDRVADCNASLAIIEKSVQTPMLTQKVKSTKKTLYKLISKYREKLTYPFIAITGSNGKTTTKELLCHVLSENFNVMKTKGNFNSTIGAPLSILTFSKDADVGIIEMGANHPGEIKAICQIIKPDMGLITNIGEAHIGNFNSIHDIALTKGALFSSLPNNGIAFINKDDDMISKIDVTCSRIEYSFNTTADYRGIWSKKNRMLKLNNINIDLSSYPDSIYLNSLAVFSIASELGCKSKSIASLIKSFNIPKGRGEIIKLENYKIINDSYNANYESTKLGIGNLSKITCSNRRIVVIGDMLELGNKAAEYHKKIGRYLIKKNIDAVFAYGELSKYIINNMVGSKAFYKIYSNKNMLVTDLKKYLKKDDIIYIKGSRTMQMEDIIEGLMP